MIHPRKALALHVLLGALAATHAGCRKPAPPPPTAPAAHAGASAAPAPDEPADTSAAQSSEGAPAGATRKVCEIVSAADVGKITSQTYSELNSQADLATIKHCEYRGGAHVISITVVEGDNASSRFKTSQQFPGTSAVTGLGEQAIWEPVRGALAAYYGSRTVEVMVSAAHGDGATRQELARSLVELVVERL